MIYAEAFGLETTCRVFAAIDQGAPAAVLTFDEVLGTLEMVFVQEDYRRQGLATKLLQVVREDTGEALDRDTGLRSGDGARLAKALGIKGIGRYRRWAQAEAEATGARLMVGLWSAESWREVKTEAAA